jgi:sporulation protein YlmC with PRC-barrel domain
MKKLLSTTALVVALGFPTLTLAQTTTTETQQQQGQQQQGQMSGFLAERGQGDLLASDLMGRDVYARRGQTDAAGTDGQATMGADGSREMATMNRADLDNMDNIGQVNEIVLSHDGQVRALVIGVGGFLGMGEQDVAVTMDQVSFTSDVEDRSQTYIVVNVAAEELRDSPNYDRTAMAGDRTQQSAGAGTERTNFTAPDMQREGYQRVEITEITTETLMGHSVYDVNDNDVGSVTDMIIGEDGAITNVIIDFGGFLGIGSSQAALSYDELTILSTEGYSDVRIYVDATKEQIQNLPQYQARN